MLVAFFKDGHTATYTRGLYPLLVSDAECIRIMDADTDTALFNREGTR